TYKYNGNTETEQVLTGLAPANVPSKETLNAAAPAGQCFKAWDKDVTAAVTADIEFNAIYTNDANDNDIPDDEEDVVTVTFRYNITPSDEKVETVSVILGESVPADKIPSVAAYQDGDYDVKFIGWTPDVTAPVTAETEFRAVTEKVFVPANYDLDRTAERSDFKGFNDAESLADKIIAENDLKENILADLNRLIADGYQDASTDPRTVYGQAHQDAVNAAEKALRDYVIGLDRDNDGKIDDDYIRKYTVTFMVNDVAGASVIVRKGENAKYPSDAPVTLTKAPTADKHYTFVGFNDGNGNFWNSDTITDVTTDITVYAVFEAGAHKGGEATCQHKAVCEVCGVEYGGLGDHKFVTVPAKEATCTEKGHTSYEKCSVCGEIRGDAHFTDALGHSVDFTKAVSTGTSDDGSYTWNTYKCIRCEYKEVVITIIALDENGNPISGAEVEINGENGTTDSDGKYTTKPIGDGSYDIKVNDESGMNKGEGTLVVKNGNVTGSFTDGSGRLYKYTCGHCLCHRNNIFGKILRWLCTLFSVLFRKHIKCCPDMQWYGGLIKWLT
ncbi:MAG: hypothetical protein PUB94_07990, partial [Oscillospiraceae bacterium]|nr:hypothetical protein [Oscillospiraceae bacterium]